MGIIDRLGEVIKSYLNDEDRRIFGTVPGRGQYPDPDLEAAFEELDSFLNGGKSPGGKAGGYTKTQYSRTEYTETKTGTQYSRTEYTRTEYGRKNSRRGNTRTAKQNVPGKEETVPEALRQDFVELGVPIGADERTCKTAHKKLLKIHHPDRHAGHPENTRRATEKSARINAAYDRIEKWRTEQNRGSRNFP
jgi:hypothetical protein